jgi:leucyl-tRNA synthetase
MEKKFKRTLVTTALPYANGPVHIGHLAGVYVPADIYTRFLRMRGEDVVLIGGSDEHGVPITIKAKAEGVTPQDIVDRYHKIIKDSFQELGISLSIHAPRPISTPPLPRSFSVVSTTTISLWRKPQCSSTMRKPTNSLPTVM